LTGTMMLSLSLYIFMGSSSVIGVACLMISRLLCILIFDVCLFATHQTQVSSVRSIAVALVIRNGRRINVLTNYAINTVLLLTVVVLLLISARFTEVVKLR